MRLSIAIRLTSLRRNLVSCCTPHLQARGVTPGLLYCVLYVGRHPGCTAGEVARFLQADPGQTTRAMGKLAGEGFVTRETDPKDHRVTRLALTGKGEALFADSRAMLEAWGSEAMAALTEEEVEQLWALLSKMSPIAELDFPPPEN